jgi:hypothetical protein
MRILVLAVELRERYGAIGDARITPKNYVAVHVVAAERGPLVTDQRRESSGLVVAVGQGSVGVPGIANRLVARDRCIGFRQRRDDFHCGRKRFIRVAAQHVVSATTLFCREDFRVAFEQLRHESVHLRVVGNNEKVQRARQLHSQAMSGDPLFPAGESKSVFLADPVHGPGIYRDRRMQMSIPPEHPGWKFTADVRRILGFGHLGRNRIFAWNLVLRETSRSECKVCGDQKTAAKTLCLTIESVMTEHPLLDFYILCSVASNTTPIVTLTTFYF